MARTLDEILTTEMPDVVTQAREKAEQMRLEVHMSHLREMLTKAGTEPMICGSSRDLGEVEVDRQGAGKLAVSKHTTTITLLSPCIIL
ncbi:hypothetical protein, partial [Aeromonas caviae]|uniref:hypothetical protein n=1 Tax=Aeromonas caviae TaxID=648 RepID=UPI0035A24322